VKKARCRYTTIQNWSNNVYNLVTKRAVAHEGATMEWVDGNIGSKVTMKYPSVYLTGEHAKGETLSVAFAGPGQHQDAGAKMVHAAPNTSIDRVEVGGARWRTHVLPRPGAASERVRTIRSQHRCAATRCSSTHLALGHLPLRRRPRRRRQLGHEATVSKRERRPAVLPHVARHDRRRGDGHDRPRASSSPSRANCPWSTRSNSTGSSSSRWKVRSGDRRSGGSPPSPSWRGS
jgi:hypothetical protein